MINNMLSNDILSSLALIATTELADGRLMSCDVRLEPHGRLWRIDIEDALPVVKLAPVWETLARIERIEVLTYCLLRCVVYLRTERLRTDDKHMLRACRLLGVCSEPVQVVAQRFRLAGAQRINDEHRLPIDEFEDREKCIICHLPIGTWDKQFEQLHHGCVMMVRRNLRLSEAQDADA